MRKGANLCVYNDFQYSQSHTLLFKQTTTFPTAYLSKLVPQLVNRQRLPLLEQREVGLLAEGGLLAADDVFLPLGQVLGGDSGAADVRCERATVVLGQGVYPVLVETCHKGEGG